MIFACHPDFIGMTLMNEKGGDVYGQLPKRIAVARSLPSHVIARSRRRRGNLKRSAKGNRRMPGPGKNALPYFLALEGRGLR